MNMKVGLICSITDKIADFEESCDNFVEDEVADQIEFRKKMAATGDHKTGDPLNFKKNKRNGAIIFIFGCLVTIISYMYRNELGIYAITHGVITYGAIQYGRGVQQEKIILKQEEKGKNYHQRRM